MKPLWTTPQPELAVELAKDFLFRLEAEQWKPRTGSYMHFRDNRFLEKLNNVFPDNELQPLLLQENPKCQGCMLGGLWYSLVIKKDNYKVRQYRVLGPSICQLDEVFGFDQARILECAFEGWGVPGNLEGENLLDYDAVQRYLQIEFDNYGDPLDKGTEELRRRAKIILNNIIRHKGTFMLPEFDGFIPEEVTV